MKKLIFILCLSAITFSSCKKDDVTLSSTGYLVFGHFYGECIGETCVEIFRLEEDKLFEDMDDKYPNSTGFYNGDYKLLSQEKFDEVKDLKDAFPNNLLSETDTVIGQPDAGDWGGIYLEYNYNGIRKFWLLDQMKSNVPLKYQDYIDMINEKIALLQ